MKEVKYNKQMQSAYKQYLWSSKTQLFDCYDNPSRAKFNAYDYCLSLFREYNGSDFRIIGYNTFGFSVGFMFEKDGKKCLAYITKDHDRYFEID